MRPLALRDKDLAALRDTFRRFPAVREVRVFGSRATGHAGRASDLDLAIFAPEASPAEWADLCDALENAPVIYELDLVRAQHPANGPLQEKITREGVLIYPDPAPR
jgi:predicted nucleotidyltransferase